MHNKTQQLDLPDTPEPVLPITSVAYSLPEDAKPVDHETAAAVIAMRRLLTEKPQYAKLHGVMVALRQLYVVAYSQLQDWLELEGELPQLTEDLFVSTAALQAQQQFDIHEVMTGVAQSVVPWAAVTADARVEADQQALRDEEHEREVERRAFPIPVGFEYSGLPEEKRTCGVLPRAKGLIIVGWRPAVQYLLDLAVSETLKCEWRQLSVVRFCAAGSKQESAVRALRIGSNQWAGCCNARDSLAKFFRATLAPMLSGPPDLLICEDMVKAYTKSFVGRLAASTAGDANKAFSRWCTERGCAFIGAITCDSREPVDIRGPEYEQLRTFALLRQVIVTEQDGQYAVSIGRSAPLLVPMAELDDYGRPQLVV